MQREERDAAHLSDMLAFAMEVIEFTDGISLEMYLAQLQTRRATERSIELLGEAARRVSETTRAEVVEIPWRNIVGLRNLLAHEYGVIQDTQIWEAATSDVPVLVEQLRRLVSP